MLALGARQKLAFLRPRPSPPQANSGHINFMQVFLHAYIFMFLRKEEKPEMYDFERRKKNVVLKEKHFWDKCYKKASATISSISKSKYSFYFLVLYE